VRVSLGQVSGAAGGERNTTARRMAVAGLAASLRDLPPVTGSTPPGPVSIHTTSDDLAAFAGLLADPAERARGAGPEDDLDLWAQILTASAGRRLHLVRAPLQLGTPTVFASAWADLAMDKAKATGAFTAAIPKPNLTKVPGLGLK
jgi:hypothetical protein